MISLLTLDSVKIEDVLPFIPVSYMRESLDDSGIMGKSSLSFYGILNNGEAVGSIVSEAEGTVCIIRYMEISEKARGQGIGLESLYNFAYRCRALGFESLQCRYIPDNDPAFDTIAGKLGFVRYVLPYGFHRVSVKKVLSHFKDRKKDKTCRNLSKLSPIEMKAFTASILQNLSYGVAFPISGDFYDMEVSCCIMEGYNCIACLLVEKEREGEHYIRWLHNSSNNPACLMKLVMNAAIEGEKLYGEEAVITAVSTDPDICHSIEAIGRKRVIPMVEALLSFDQFFAENEMTGDIFNIDIPILF